ncbi:MAG TPA: D-TA family PLP-dependent enzyme [Puia sp.]|jgi:D-serine deaminase-like pyridoxal phosphate-dependent protein|nr:D-TA family PLP-dependent enzyme [Puia sp.]
MKEKLWYEVENIEEIDSPALLIFPSRAKENIHKLTEKIKVQNLRPHVKTNKIAEVCNMMLESGIGKFKAATIAEAEMLAMIKAPDTLLAYPVNSPKIKRLIRLIKKYSGTKFSCIVDRKDNAQLLSRMFNEAGLIADIYIDLNVGMNRTGIAPENAMNLYREIYSLPSIKILGLHAYDGHLKDPNLNTRTENCNKAFAPVIELRKEMEKLAGHPMTLIAGGSPTCFIHAAAGDRECSPGTFIFWDKGNSEQLPEQPFEWAAILVCRIISIPTPDKICVDLGHKSVAAENPQPRVYFLNAPEAIPTAQSEEHLVLNVPESAKYKTGDVLYGVPWHVCPSVALYEKAHLVENNRVNGFWKVVARNREISV